MKEYITPFNSNIYFDDESRISNHDEVLTKTQELFNNGYATKFYGNSGYTSFFNGIGANRLYDLPEFAELKTTIINKADEYIKKQICNDVRIGTGYEFNKNLSLTYMWFNFNKPTAYQGKHHHAKHLLAGTYYLKVPKASGMIRFYNPLQLAYYLDREVYEDTMLVSQTSIPVQEGDLLIWPGWMDHEVESNKSTDDRITISFCIDFEAETVLN